MCFSRVHMCNLLTDTTYWRHMYNPGLKIFEAPGFNLSYTYTNMIYRYTRGLSHTEGSC